MREPARALPSEIESIPDQPAVFLLWASPAGDVNGAKPYLARTALLRRRLKRLISERDRVSRLLNLRGVVERIEYWITGSQIESALIHLELARQHFPDDWPRITRLRPPHFVRLTLDNPFPRTMVTTRLGRGLFYGPFASRATAEHFQTGVLDLFQIRRCEENLAPSPEHPGCIYGEMNRCLRPCQTAVSMEEYRGEAARVEQFLRTHADSLIEVTEVARDRASVEMQFEEAERLHQRLIRIHEVQTSSGELARSISELNGVAITGSAAADVVELWFLIGGAWQEPVRLAVSEAAAAISMDRRLREVVASVTAMVTPVAAPNLEHLSILMRWHSSTWRDGEWIGFDSLAKVPYRKLVNAVGRVHAHSKPKTTAP
jgi:excinuclease ABC subunit C